MSNDLYDLYLIGTNHCDVDGIFRLEHILNKLNPDIITLEMSEDRDDNSKLIEKDLELKMIKVELEAVKILINNIEQETKAREILLRDDKTLFKSLQQDYFRNVNKRFDEKQLAAFATLDMIVSGISNYELKVSKVYVNKNKNSQLKYIDLNVLQKRSQEFAKGYKILERKSIKKVFESDENSHGFLSALDEGSAKVISNLRKGISNKYKNYRETARVFEKIRKNIHKIYSDSNLTESEKLVLKAMYNPERDKKMCSEIRNLIVKQKDKALIALIGLGHLLPLEIALADYSPKVLTLGEYENV